MKCICRLLNRTQPIRKADGTRRAAAGRPKSRRLSHRYLLHGNNHPFVVSIDATPPATSKGGKYASAVIAKVVDCSFVRACVCVCFDANVLAEGESHSTYYNLRDCKDTKKAIEGIKDLEIELVWNLLNHNCLSRSARECEGHCGVCSPSVCLHVRVYCLCSHQGTGGARHPSQQRVTLSIKNGQEPKVGVRLRVLVSWGGGMNACSQFHFSPPIGPK